MLGLASGMAPPFLNRFSDEQQRHHQHPGPGIVLRHWGGGEREKERFVATTKLTFLRMFQITFFPMSKEPFPKLLS